MIEEMKELVTSSDQEKQQENTKLDYRKFNARGRIRHGITSKHVRKRYMDKRTREYKRLETIMQEMVCDLGGHENLSSFQRLLLDNIRSKLIIIMQISKYCDDQLSIIGPDGNLLPALRREFNTYSESLRRDIEALHGLSRGKRKASYQDELRRIKKR